ncbi:MAG: response regulator [Lachnospiraceae bacterium]|nr:response regulator [Lachnospiraceae bacterium]
MGKQQVKMTGRDKRMRIYKWFFFAFLFLTVCLFFCFNHIEKEKAYTPDAIEYIEHWTVTESNGHTFTTGREFTDNREYEGKFTIESTLPARVHDQDMFCTRVSLNAGIYINDELRYDFDGSSGMPFPGGSVKSFYAMVPLNSLDSGASIRIVRSTDSKTPLVVGESIVSTQSGVLHYLMNHFGLSFVLSAVLCVFAGVTAMVGIGMQLKYKRHVDMFYGALAVLVVACWLVTNSYLYPFIFGHYYIDGILNYLFSLMLPFGPILYIDSIQHGRKRNFMAVLMAISVASALIWTVLHFTGVMSFWDSLIYINIIQIMTLVAGAFILIKDLVDGYFHEYRFTAIGFIGFIVFSLLELVVIIFIKPKNDDIPMLLGLNFLLVFVVVQQVDDMRRIYEEKQNAIAVSDAKTKFLANMSHEIRTPINAILGMNEMILRENKDKVIDGYARNVKSSGRMLLTLVNDVLDFSKIEAGKIEISCADYSLTRVLSEVVPLVEERAHAKNLEFKVEIQKGVPDGQNSDEFRIKQVLVNLLNNAVKYTDQGSVTLNVGGVYNTENSFMLELTVTDTGRGIKKGDQEYLFDAFSRADMQKNRSIEGTGLGLAIVKSIMNSMGGEISVESEYGEGSSFRVKLPVGVVSKNPVQKNQIGVTFEEADTAGCDFTAPYARVLAVDDNKANLTIVRLFLKRTGIKPDLCNSGTEAIELCKQNKYDLILLDHMMPTPDGIETLSAIRNDEESLNKDTTAIVLTANAVAGSRQMYLDAGFADYLTKPLDSIVLEQTVKQYLPFEKILPVVNDNASRQLDNNEKSLNAVQEDDTGDDRETANSIGGERIPEPAEEKVEEEDYSVVEFLPSDGDEADEAGQKPLYADLKEKLSQIKEMDYDTAMMHCANDEAVLAEILDEIAGEGRARANRMFGFIKEKDWASYRVEAHAIKGLMATIGVPQMSERARKHEFAGRDEQESIIEEDGNEFIEQYVELCDSIGEALRQSR